VKPSTFRANLKTLIEGITPSVTHGINTGFRVLSQSADPATAPPRSCRLTLVRQPARLDLNTEDAREAEWSLVVFHPWATLIDDVIADDSDLLEVELCAANMIALSSDVIDVTVSPVGVDEQSSLVASRFSIVGRYRLDAAVLA
jgi:hypothetical protein